MKLFLEVAVLVGPMAAAFAWMIIESGRDYERWRESHGENDEPAP